MWWLRSLLYYYGYWLSILYHKSVYYLVPVSERVSFVIVAAFRLVRRVVGAADTIQPLKATHSMLLSVDIAKLTLADSILDRCIVFSFPTKLKQPAKTTETE